MPYLAGVATATPPHTLEQKDAKRFAAQLFGPASEHILPVFDNAMIDRRHFAMEPEWFFMPHTFTEANDAYIERSLRLAEEVVCKLADSSKLLPKDFDAIFFVSTTGISTPSIDARLFNRIPLSEHIKRIPIWGLGCAAGVAAIARASEYVRAFPTHRAIVVSVELCSLAFQLNDRSKANIIAAALFADAAAAMMICGDDVPKSEPVSYPCVKGTLSTIYPDTLDVMGWRISSDGFRIVLSRDIPSIVTSLVKKNVEELVLQHGINISDIRHYAAHPGGAKVMEAYASALSLDGELHHSLDVLREYGNMSSATVFFILERLMAETRNEHNAFGLISALGPGFSSELVLVEWK